MFTNILIKKIFVEDARKIVITIMDDMKGTVTYFLE